MFNFNILTNLSSFPSTCQSAFCYSASPSFPFSNLLNSFLWCFFNSSIDFLVYYYNYISNYLQWQPRLKAPCCQRLPLGQFETLPRPTVAAIVATTRLGIGALQSLSSAQLSSVQLSSALAQCKASQLFSAKVLCGNLPLTPLYPLLLPLFYPLCCVCASRARGTCQKARTFEQKQILALGRVCDSVCATVCVCHSVCVSVYYNA